MPEWAAASADGGDGNSREHTKGFERKVDAQLWLLAATTEQDLVLRVRDTHNARAGGIRKAIAQVVTESIDPRGALRLHPVVRR